VIPGRLVGYHFYRVGYLPWFSLVWLTMWFISPKLETGTKTQIIMQLIYWLTSSSLRIASPRIVLCHDLGRH